MAVDACEENLLEKGMGTHARELAKKRMQGEKAAKTERTPAPNDKSFDKMRPGGSNSQFNKDGSKKTKRYNPGFDPEKASETTGP